MSWTVKMLEARDQCAASKTRLSGLIFFSFFLDGIVLLYLWSLAMLCKTNSSFIPVADPLSFFWKNAILFGCLLIFSACCIIRCFKEIQKINKDIANINNCLWGAPMNPED